MSRSFLLTFLLLSACRPVHAPLYRQALGSEIGAERTLGRCRTQIASGAVVRREGDGTLRAARVGDVRLRCQRGPLRVEVREVVRLALSGGSDAAPAAIRMGQSVRLAAIGYDARGGWLNLAGVPLDWAPRGVMEQTAPPGCTTGACPADGSAWFRPLQAGFGEVHVRYRALTAAALFEVK